MEIIFCSTSDQDALAPELTEIEGELDATIYHAKDMAELEKLFHQHKTAKCIVLKADSFVWKPSSINNKEASKRAAGFFIQGKEAKDQELLLTQEESFDHVYCVDHLTGATGMVRSIKKYFHIEAESERDFCKVKLSRLLRYNNVQCDVYVKLSQRKFVKIINKDELYDPGLVESFVKKNITDFYVERNDFKDFCDFITCELMFNLKTEEIKTSDIIDNSLGKINHAHEIVQNLGIDENVIKLVDRTFKEMLAIIQEEGHFENILKILAEEKNFIYEHSLLIAYVGTVIAENLSYTTESIVQKIVLAAIFHDIALEDEELAKIHDLSSAEAKRLSWKELKKIKSHPNDSGDLLKKSKKFPSDLHQIIANHHENPDGSGFPRGITSKQIPPLACIFILAEQFAIKCFESNDQYNIDFSGIIKGMQESYSEGNFKRPMQAISEIISK